MNAKINTPEWRDIILRLNELLVSIDTYDILDDKIPDIEDFVEEGFNLLGIFPLRYPEGLPLSII